MCDTSWLENGNTQYSITFCTWVDVLFLVWVYLCLYRLVDSRTIQIRKLWMLADIVSIPLSSVVKDFVTDLAFKTSWSVLVSLWVHDCSHKFSSRFSFLIQIHRILFLLIHIHLLGSCFCSFLFSFYFFLLYASHVCIVYTFYTSMQGRFLDIQGLSLKCIPVSLSLGSGFIRCLFCSACVSFDIFATHSFSLRVCVLICITMIWYSMDLSTVRFNISTSSVVFILLSLTLLSSFKVSVLSESSSVVTFKFTAWSTTFEMASSIFSFSISLASTLPGKGTTTSVALPTLVVVLLASFFGVITPSTSVMLLLVGAMLPLFTSSATTTCSASGKAIGPKGLLLHMVVAICGLKMDPMMFLHYPLCEVQIQYM